MMTALAIAAFRLLLVARAVVGTPTDIGISVDVIVLPDSDQWSCRHYDAVLYVDDARIGAVERGCEPDEVRDVLENASE